MSARWSFQFFSDRGNLYTHCVRRYWRRNRKRSLVRQAVDALWTARTVRDATGKTVAAQLAEIASLIRLPNRITPDEYFALRLFDDAALDWSGKSTFIGRRAKPYVYKVNRPSWQALADDKLACLAQLAAFGLPVPRTVAVHAQNRSFPGARTLRTREEVARFLRHEAEYPLFSKPNAGTLGRSAYAMTEYVSASDRLTLKNGTSVSVDSYLDELQRVVDGTIFQELVVPHPAIRTLCGDRLATVRALVLNGPSALVIHRTVWRIPVGANMVDNFAHGRSGNLLGSIDPETGRLLRVVGGTGLDLRTVDAHPDTGCRFADVVLPDWGRLTETCRAAGCVMSGLRIQGWDIALSDRGPLLMEVNFNGDLDLIQLADGRGVADEVWRRFIAAC